MHDFDARRKQFDREFDRTRRRIRVWTIVMAPFYLAGGLLVLAILGLIAYGLARYVGAL